MAKTERTLTRIITVTAIALAIPVASLAAPDPNFDIICQVLDEAGTVEKTRFEGGETAQLRLLLKFSDDAYSQKMTLRTFALAKIKRFNYDITIPVSNIDIPAKEQRLQIPGYTPDLQNFTPFRQIDTLNGVDVETSVKVKLPKNIPNTRMILRAIGTVENYGERTCEQTVQLAN